MLHVPDDPYRIETDSLGAVKVPRNRYYGAQTERSRQNFPIGNERVPLPVIHSLAKIKKAAALENGTLGTLPVTIARYVAEAAAEVEEGKFDDEFVLSVFQTGSGTHTNMNVNEVVARRALELSQTNLCEALDEIHPNDHVNCGQSSNDTFSAAMHVAVSLELRERLFATLSELGQTLGERRAKVGHVLKLGRTHYQDAVPMTFGQELDAYRSQFDFWQTQLDSALSALNPLPLGGTAIGTGLGAHPRLAEGIARRLSAETGRPFCVAGNKAALIAGHDALLFVHQCLNGLATVALKLTGDLRFLSSGPRAGIGELSFPPNEPGSSIMPGKVNPTQAEALSMVAMDVMGAHTTLTMAAAHGHLQLNVTKPLIAARVLSSLRNLSDALSSFSQRCLAQLAPNEERSERNVAASLSLATALNAHLGYDKASQMAHFAHENDLTLKQAALEMNLLSAEEFDRLVNPRVMTGEVSGERPGDR